MKNLMNNQDLTNAQSYITWLEGENERLRAAIVEHRRYTKSLTMWKVINEGVTVKLWEALGEE